MKIKTRLSAHCLSCFITFACLSVLLFVSPVEAQTRELKFMLSRENLCAFNGQSTDIPLSVDPGDDIIVQVKNNTPANHFFHWQGTMYPTAITQPVSHRFFSLQKLVEAGETLRYQWKMGNQGILIHGCRSL
jgi:manganese oxidase